VVQREKGGERGMGIGRKGIQIVAVKKTESDRKGNLVGQRGQSVGDWGGRKKADPVGR